MVLPGRLIPSCFPAPLPCLLLLLLLLLLPPLTLAKFWNKPSLVSVPAACNASKPFDYTTTNFRIKVVLSRLNSEPSFFLGFRCFDDSFCYFGLFIFQPTRDVKISYPDLVWFVSEELMNDLAQLRLTQEGDLVLLGDRGKKMWSTNTVGKSVVGLNLTEVGNLVLYDRNDAIVWQSFDHPANIILPGQELRPGMKLTATSRAPDGTARIYTFTTDDQIGFVASVSAAYSPQIYYITSNVSEMKSDNGQVGALYKNGTFGEFELPLTSSAQFIRLEYNGHLKRYYYDEHSSYPLKETDLLEDKIINCDYPLVCGRYGICLSDSDCVCPSETKPIEERNPSIGCKPISPISCDSLK